MLKIILITLRSLLGMARSTAYANKKYHSGLICGGVTIWLQGMKLSASKKSVGREKTRNIIVIRARVNVTESFIRNAGSKFNTRLLKASTLAFDLIE